MYTGPVASHDATVRPRAIPEQTMRNSRIFLSLSLLALFLTIPAITEDWTRFRGNNGVGTSASKGLPAEFGPDKNKLWEAEVPFGRSSPVVAGNRIYLTATDDGKFVTMALDRKTGKTLWSNSVKPSRSDEFHSATDSATTTPVTDGKNVYVFFQEFGLVAYDKNGKERWKYEMGPFRNFYSIAASPVLSGNMLYMLCDQAEGSFLVALDKSSGKEKWRRNRPGRLESYTTPILYPAKARSPRRCSSTEAVGSMPTIPPRARPSGRWVSSAWDRFRRPCSLTTRSTSQRKTTRRTVGRRTNPSPRSTTRTRTASSLAKKSPRPG